MEGSCCETDVKQTYVQVTWAKRFPQLLRLDLSSASYDQFGDLVRSDMDSPESDSGEALGTEDAIVPGTVTELAWGSEQSDDLVTGSSAQCRSPFLAHGDRRWLVINIFSNRLPGCVSVTALEVAGTNCLVPDDANRHIPDAHAQANMHVVVEMLCSSTCQV